MSPQKHFLIFIFLGIILSLKAYSQPKACTDPSSVWGGTKIGGEFGFDNAVCLDPVTGTATLNLTPANALAGLNNVKYIYNVKDNTTTYLGEDATSHPLTKADAGVYWVLQMGNDGANILNIKCHSIFVFDPQVIPDAKLVGCQKSAKIVFQTGTKTNYDTYVIDWGDGTPLESITGITTYPHTTALHNYTDNLTHTVNVVGKLAAYLCESKPSTKIHTPTSNMYISHVEMTDNDMGVKVDFVNADPSVTYKLRGEKNGSGNWDILVPSASTNASMTIPATPGLDKTANYCFRLEGTDACGNAGVTLPVCSIKTTANVVSTNEVLLNWNNLAPSTVVQYQVSRSDNSTSPVKNPSITDTKYDDKTVVCNGVYTYIVEGSYTDANGNPVVTVSSPIRVSPSGLANLPVLNPFGLASVEDNNSKIKFVIVDLDVSKRNAYRFERLIDNDTFSSWTTVATNDRNGSTGPSNIYIDDNVDVLQHRYCYRVSYSDACGNWSPPTVPFCSILLTTDGIENLYWTPFIDNPAFNNYITYTVYKVDPITGIASTPISGLVDIKNTKSVVTVPDNLDSETFVVVANYTPPGIPLGADLPSVSNTITIQMPAKVFVPNAFTPNGDDKNQNFVVQGKHIDKYGITIYDRWGNPIFSSDDITNSWDGKMNDKVTEAPSGVYGYVITIKDTHGQTFSRTGSITLIR